MKILVFNAGSSSLKFGVFQLDVADSRIVKGEFKKFGPQGCILEYRIGGEQGRVQQREDSALNIEAAFTRIPAFLEECGHHAVDAIGHRVAHGGERFYEPALIDQDVLRHIEACTPLAPLHNPANIRGMSISRTMWPDVPQVAVFDTAFHRTMPQEAYTYAIPAAWRALGLRRYGFHGTSHKYVGLRVANELNQPVTSLNIISCHLGNGASVCAIAKGFSIDTSMGMTPLEGLVMGSRSGDVDPGIFAFLSRELNLNSSQIEDVLYTQSGLKALAGSYDMREVESRAAAGDVKAQLAITVYAYRVRKYIGAYAAALGGLDVLAFTGGIGENSAFMRRRICDKFEFLGLHLDETANQAVALKGYEAPQIQSVHSRVKIIVTQTCEQFMIAQEVRHVLSVYRPQTWRIPVAVSARHVHLSQEALEALFGAGYALTKMRDLQQPEGWAAHETVDVVGPKGTLPNVRILGPLRDATQIEVSKTDTFALGVGAPLRPSGQLEGTPMVTLRGPKGNLLVNGLIIAARHIHMSPEDGQNMRLKDGDYVDVRLGNGERGVIFANTLVRIKPGYVTEMHIDTDEANAAGIAFAEQTPAQGELIITKARPEVNILTRKNMDLKTNA